MIIYIADRNLDIIATASTELPGGLRITSDTKTESIESGAMTFECEFLYDDRTLADLVQPGNFLLRSNEDENEFYNITESETNTDTMTVRVYCEDAGLDLLNTQVPAYEASEAHNLAWYIDYFTDGWEINHNDSTGTLKLTWDGESTLTERLLSVANSFGCELSYGFDINEGNLTVSHKYLNFYKTRGNGTATVQTRLGREISKISIKRSTENLATAYLPTGTDITLKGFSHSTTINGDTYSVDTSTGQLRNTSAMARWSSVLDADGLILRDYSYETKDQTELFNRAATELSKYCDAEINYEVEFVELDASIGDRINVIDDDGELYLDTRILELSRSVTDGTVSATLGETKIKSAGISDAMITLSARVEKESIRIASVSEDLDQTSDDIQAKLNTEISERKTESLTNSEGYNLVKVASDGLVMTGTQESEASMEMSATEIVLKKDGYAAATIKSDDALGSIIDADAADISTLKMTNVNGQGSLGWVAQENNHLTLKEI